MMLACLVYTIRPTTLSRWDPHSVTPLCPPRLRASAFNAARASALATRAAVDLRAGRESLFAIEVTPEPTDE